jgi:tetratricopeptide (TPR) repeat protein
MSVPPPTAQAESSTSMRKEALVEEQNPDALEKRAEQARHAGNYPLAAGLYRRAAALRQQDAVPNASAAAWALAHAVECLAAAGQFEQARSVRDEMLHLYPSEDRAFYAASRALREVEPAAPASDAAKQ